MDVQSAEECFNRGLAHLKKGKYDRALTEFTEAIRIDPKNVKAYTGRSLAYQGLGDGIRAGSDKVKAQELEQAARLLDRSTVASPILGIWTRIETWLRINAPDLLTTLNPGVSAQDIGRAETRMATLLPEGARESYRLHDGTACPLFGGWQLLSVEAIVDAWQMVSEAVEGIEGLTAELEGPVRPQWWNPRWIPFADAGDGNHLCLDLDPAPGGQVGQVILYVHDDSQRKRIAESFQKWLEHWAEGLESGICIFSMSEGILLGTKEDLQNVFGWLQL